MALSKEAPRPWSRGVEPMQVIAGRLTAEELAAVDAVAEREHISRSEAIRRGLAGYAA